MALSRLYGMWQPSSLNSGLAMLKPVELQVEVQASLMLFMISTSVLIIFALANTMLNGKRKLDTS